MLLLVVRCKSRSCLGEVGVVDAAQKELVVGDGSHGGGWLALAEAADRRRKCFSVCEEENSVEVDELRRELILRCEDVRFKKGASLAWERVQDRWLVTPLLPGIACEPHLSIRRRDQVKSTTQVLLEWQG